MKEDNLLQVYYKQRLVGTLAMTAGIEKEKCIYLMQMIQKNVKEMLEEYI